MKTNDLIIAVRAAIIQVMTARGLAIPVKQSYQPTTQGTNSGLLLTLHDIAETRYGFEQKKDVWNEETEQFDHVQSQQIETTLQFGALGPQVPGNDAELTLSDYVRAAASALQSDACLGLLRSAGIGLTRIRDVRIVYSIDDKDQHEANPSFDATFTHRDTVIDALPTVTAREVVIHRA